MLLSDGDFNVGINDPEALEDFVSRERESGVYLFDTWFRWWELQRPADAEACTVGQRDGGLYRQPE